MKFLCRLWDKTVVCEGLARLLSVLSVIPRRRRPHARLGLRQKETDRNGKCSMERGRREESAVV